MKYKTNNVFQFGWNSDGQFIGKSYAGARRKFEIGDPSVVRVLQRTLDAVTREDGIEIIRSEVDATREEAADLFDMLVDREMLLPTDHRNFTESAEWFDKSWRRALYYHLGTRNMDFGEKEAADPDGVRRETMQSYVDESGAPGVFDSFDSEALDPLPEPESLPDERLDEVLMSRETCRAFTAAELGLQDLSTLLYNAFDPVRAVREHVEENADSDPLVYPTHSMYLPFDVYLLVARCEDLDPGVYQYSIRDHALAPVYTDIEDGNAADEMVTETIIGQMWNRGSAFTAYFVARFDRYRWQYRHSRAFRMLFMDIPTHAHRLILAATAMDKDNFLTPALRNEVVDDLLEVDGFDESPIYTVTIGE